MNREQKKNSKQRRDLLMTLWLLLGGAALISLAGIGGNFLRSFGKKPEKIKVRELNAGPVDSFAPSSVTLIREGGELYISRLEQGGFLALSKKCSHLGCTISWDDNRQQFVCPCHGSVFDFTGTVLKAPAPRALNHYPVRIADNNVHVDLARPLKRSLFTPEQLVYPKKS